VREWKSRVPIIAREFYEVLPDAKVYVFGSAVRGDITAGSDVDILVVSDRLAGGALARARLKVRAEERAGLPEYHPFEIHLVTQSEARPFIRRAKRDIVLLPRGNKASSLEGVLKGKVDYTRKAKEDIEERFLGSRKSGKL
jgi:predicted nucleotidyltransferase